MNAPQRIVEEASTLGFEPGMWPNAFAWQQRVYFKQHATYDAERELVSVTYATLADEYVVEVLND